MQTLAPLTDLRAVAAAIERTGAPLLVLYSTPGCPFCLEVRRNYLAPRAAEQAARTVPSLLLREVDIVSAATLIDLDGGAITEAQFARRQRVRMTPVVQLYGAQLQPLGAPLVGIDAAGFYDGYLERAIAQARSRLQRSS